MTEPVRQDSPDALASGPLTADYRAWPWYQRFFGWNRMPMFSLAVADWMLLDRQVWFGICVRNAPLMALEVEVTGPHEDVNKFVKEQWEHLWKANASKLVRDKNYGYMPFEVVYGAKNGRLEIETLLDRHPRDCVPLTQKGHLVGMNVRGMRVSEDNTIASTRGGETKLIGMRKLWLVYHQQYGGLYGFPLLQRAQEPWWDKAMTGGAYDMRRLRCLKDAWVGDRARYPFGKSYTDTNGNMVPARDIMQQAVSLRENGSTLVLPSNRDAEGEYLFDWEPPEAIADTEIIDRWIESCDDGIFKGLEVVKEVTEASETGSGYSGRSIPLVTQFSILDAEAQDKVRAIKVQTLSPLVIANFSCDKNDFEITPKPLLDTFASKVGGKPEGGRIGSEGQLGGDKGPDRAPPINAQPSKQDQEWAEQFSDDDGPHHAPHNMTVAGKQFRGGEFIPGNVYARATPQEKAAISSKKPQTGNAAAGGSIHPGAAHGSIVRVKKTKTRAFDGSTPVATKTTLTKQETGRVGEAVILAWLRDVKGRKDAKPMNASASNFAVDLIEDHAPTEVKAGLVSNGVDAQKWRLTFSKETAKEKAAYAKMTPQQRNAWNAHKQARIHERKQSVLDELETRTGKTFKPRTMTVVINPDTRTADIYEFDGWHDIIRWRSPEAKAAYRGSVQYA